MKAKAATTLGVTATVLLLAANVWGAGITRWTAGTGNWSNDNNWDVGEPGSSDWASINNGGTAQITAPDEACEDLCLGSNSGDSGTVDITGGGLSVSHHLSVGSFGAGTLDITGGGEVSGGGPLGQWPGSTGTVTVDGLGSTWTSIGSLSVGVEGEGRLEITGGGAVTDDSGFIGRKAGSNGEVTVNGAGSTWTNSGGNAGELNVGYEGTGILNITGGGVVSNGICDIGLHSGSTGTVIVMGTGSTWANSVYLRVGGSGEGMLMIIDRGLVSVAGTLTTDYNEDGDSEVNMATGGMLALLGEGDQDIDDFLDLVEGTDAIRYWKDGTGWDHITNGTEGVDYDLAYHTSGNLDGYTVLTVPEPATLALVGLGAAGLAALRRRRRQRK